MGWDAARGAASGLGLQIMDAHTGQARPAQSLSGGETFLASLALALGLAEVVTARDGEEGLGYLLTQHFDVLLTDLRMPVMDGFELVHHCMRLPETHRPQRIIAISGEYEAGALHNSAVAFLPKPFTLPQLAAKVKEQLGR